jgi:hypothetical protein
MRLLISRIIAILLLVIPGLIATYGFLTMKNAIFDSFGPAAFPWLRFIAGFIMFGAGVAFLGGWTFYRDRKRNYLSSRFRPKKQNRRPRPGSRG